ncbi:MAG: NUDIX hydrolase, partial [Actinomycetota bacterium]|nr:NUDIX hydrolase [Actinomycetota bacterium]
RELREETGLDVAIDRFVGSVLRPAPNGVYDIHDYAATVTGGEIMAGDDALEAIWVDHGIFTTLERSNELVPQLADTLREWDMVPR